MAYAQGSVVLVENPYGSGARPILIASNDDRPFQGKQYTFAVVTTTERNEAVRLEADDLTEGSIDVQPGLRGPVVRSRSRGDERSGTGGAGVRRRNGPVADGIDRFHERKP